MATSSFTNDEKSSQEKDPRSSPPCLRTDMVCAVCSFSPIIKIYATQKLADATMTSSKFEVLMDTYLNDVDSFQNKITKF